MSQAIAAELAPTGRLRAGVNMSNFLLVTGKTSSGDPEGVSPSMAAEIAKRLGVPVTYVLYDTPRELAEASTRDEWDIGLIGAEPARAKTIKFTAAYCEIEATYLVPAGSPFQSVDEVDSVGTRIAVYTTSAYGLWMQRNIKHAEMVPADGLGGSLDLFLEQKLDALAGLRPRLLTDVETLPGARILEGGFTAVQQAIGTRPERQASAQWLSEFAEEVKGSGFVEQLIDRFGVTGRLTVAPLA
jgi:polar amino acid transport system substrate-binding protein